MTGMVAWAVRQTDEVLPSQVKAPIVELYREAAGDNPHGAVLVGTALAAAELAIVHFLGNVLVPYAIRKHVVRANDFTIAASLFHLIGIAVNNVKDGGGNKKQ